MDEEDLQEMKESRELVDTTEEHDMLGGTRAELARRGGDDTEKDPMAAALQALLPPSKDSIGSRLLKKMGWRLGQGIGPRITYQQLRAQEGNPIQPGEQIDEENLKHLYAPRDTKLVIYNKKENAFGLGYAAGEGLTDLVRGSNGGVEAESGPNISAGFGLGALNDAEDDDIDIYDRGGSKTHRHMAYDTREEEDANDHVVVGPKFPSKLGSQNVVKSAIFKNGRPVVSGFVVSESPLIETRRFPLAEVPQGWVPDPRRVWATDPSMKEDESKPLPAVKTHKDWVKGKTADERGALLGETPLPSAPRSVFDYLSQKDKDRLKNMSASIASGTAFPKTSPETQTAAPTDMPTLAPQMAEAAMKGFQPFSKDPEKQLRYTTFLQSQKTPDDAPKLRPLPGQSSEEFHKEISDYVKSAQIFKPVTGAMANRFASSVTVEAVGVQHPGLYQPTQEDYAKLDLVKDEEKKKEQENPKANAAKLDMFGPMTREVKTWIPARLLLKRFGVKDPYPDGVPGDELPPETSVSAKNDAWQEEVLKAAPELKIPTTTSSSDANATGSSGKSSQRDLANIGLGEDEEQGKDTLTYERPSMDIFKAIFASDEEDSDDEPEKKEDEEPADIGEPPAEVPLNESQPPVSQSLATVSYEPATGNRDTEKVDLSTFKPTFVPRSERSKEKKEKKDKDKKKKGKIVVSFDVEEDGGGGARPSLGKEKDKKDRPHKRTKAKAVDDDLDEGMWVEKPPPEIVKGLVLPTSVDPVVDNEVPSHPRGRKRAVDFI